ncbi:MAG: class II fumarate hydratase [Pseudomonadales bacterium]|nr:class II fumarate hydratase [Pseudomonadales bacterium]
MSKSNYRQESDSMGSLKVPADALYAAQTQRAVENFPVSGLVMPEKFIHAICLIKESAARVNLELKLLDKSKADAIQLAAQDIRAGDFLAHFPVDVFQTGSATSSNMNANEVLANMASKTAREPVLANDHVNMGQSSNDVVPTAIHLSASIAINDTLLPALAYLKTAIDKKGATLAKITKTGRTHLMDAMPLTMEQELSAWSAQISSNIARIESVLPRLHALGQGGTAIGTGINAHPEFKDRMATVLSELTGLTLTPNSNLFESIATQDTAVELSGQLKTTAVSIMKIANDLRWMNSGPLAGLGEIALTALQPGSSIMPGKVNPVIPEAAAMVAAHVIGNDAAITIGGQSGNFQLNVMLPMIAYNLLQSIELLSNVAKLLADKAIADFKVREDTLNDALARNPILVTALNPIIGYAKAAEIAKKAYKDDRALLDVAEEMTDISRSELERLLDAHKLTAGGIQE